MNNQYYPAPGASNSQYVPYAVPDPFERELALSYNEALENGCAALQNMSLNDLRTINENPDHLSTFVKDSFLTRPMVKTMISYRDKVKSEADHNLQLRPQFNESLQIVHQKYKELQDLQSSYKDANKVYLQLCQKYNPHNIAEGLHNSVMKIDEESEKIAENFLSGSMDLDSFLDDYVRHRTMSHSQKTKHEKLTSQLEKLREANHFQS